MLHEYDTDLIDSHAHLTQLQTTDYNPRALRAIISIATSLQETTELEQLSQKYANVYYTVGQHPTHVEYNAEDCYTNLDNYLRELSSSSSNQYIHKLVGIGETGLDIRASTMQESIFRAHLEIAAKYQLPIVVHSRDMDDTLIRVLEQYPTVHGVLHCWTGTINAAYNAISLGWFVSFSGIVTFGKKALHIQEQAKILPIDRIMFETDSPYLSPEPVRGRTNQPSNVRHVYEFVAQLRNVSLDSLVKQVVCNVQSCFPRLALRVCNRLS